MIKWLMRQLATSFWRIFAGNPDTLMCGVSSLTGTRSLPLRPALPNHGTPAGVTKVLGIESRGFLLGGAAALQLECGFVAIRKSDGLLPGPKLTVEAEPDYRGRRHQLRMQAILTTSDRVLLVDDWAEHGSQAHVARRLVEAAGATFLGVSLLVDQLTAETRSTLGTVTSLVTAEKLELSSD
jgi:adenine/guanine phosphoribosyltransferase-like PRPP-binding protein